LNFDQRFLKREQLLQPLISVGSRPSYFFFQLK
jgi:hypothetical protein